MGDSCGEIVNGHRAREVFSAVYVADQLDVGMQRGMDFLEEMLRIVCVE